MASQIMFLSKRLSNSRGMPPFLSMRSQVLPAAKLSTLAKYTLKSEATIEEFGGAKAKLYIHKDSGAEVLSVESKDDNKVFGVTFKTPPSRSDGVAHILEHSVLCGSRKYPIKEPFVELMKGSMNTFLNAFTYPDRTCYPVASTNLQDFYNLVDVYLDAVFFPNLTPLTFAQEGWHHEVDTAGDNTSLKYTGVVFNEMKGVYSQPDALLGRYEQQALFPDNCYHVDSGGDPQVIPKLTFDEFASFHKEYYHPSNAKVFFFGDDPPDKRLEMVDEYFRDVLDRSDTKPSPLPSIATTGERYVKYQEKHESPLPPVHAPYAWTEDFDDHDQEDDFSSSKGKHFLTLNWVLNDEPLTLEEMMELSIVNYLLLGTSGSILYRKLMASNLGSSIAGGGLSEELLQHTFSVGLKGAKEEDLDKISDLILDTMNTVVLKDGFSNQSIEAALNTLEFQLRELNSGGIPRGLALMLSINPGWLYHDQPFEYIRYNPALASIRKRLQGGEKVFENALEKYLVDNKHRVLVNLYPDSKHEDYLQVKEEEALKMKRSSLAEKDFDEIRQLQKDLEEHQSTPDSPDSLRCIPSLKVSDLRTNILTVPKQIVESNDGKKQYEILLHEQEETNGIVYVDCMIPIRGIAVEDLPLLPILSRCMTETGTYDTNEVDFIENLCTHTGGISVSIMVAPLRKDLKGFKYDTNFEDDFEVRLVLRGKSTESKVAELFTYMSDAVCNANLNLKEKILEIFNENYIGMESTLVGSGHSIGSSLLGSQLKKSLWVKEQFRGMGYYQSMKKQSENFALDEATDSFESFQSSLMTLRSNIIENNNVLLNITGSANGLTSAMKYTDLLLNKLPMSRCLRRDEFLVKDDFVDRSSTRNHAVIIPSQVNYVSQGGFIDNGSKANERVRESAQVVARHVQNSWLWDQIRVKGNAYGAFCGLNSTSGTFSYGSYRDPNIAETFQTYDGTASFLLNDTLTSEQLQKAIIGYMSDQDAPQHPSSRGYNSALRHLLNISDDNRQVFRNEVLSTSVDDFGDFANAINGLPSSGIKVVVGSESACNDYIKSDEEEWQIHKVM